MRMMTYKPRNEEMKKVFDEYLLHLENLRDWKQSTKKQMQSFFGKVEIYIAQNKISIEEVIANNLYYRTISIMMDDYEKIYSPLTDETRRNYENQLISFFKWYKNTKMRAKDTAMSKTLIPIQTPSIITQSEASNQEKRIAELERQLKSKDEIIEIQDKRISRQNEWNLQISAENNELRKRQESLEKQIKHYMEKSDKYFEQIKLLKNKSRGFFSRMFSKQEAS